MVQAIVGAKGKGKTRRLFEVANETVKNAKDMVVYLDKSTKHMYEFSNKIRLINVNDYEIMSSDDFTGLISGITSQDHDLETMFFDSFLKFANLKGGDIAPVVDTLEKIGEKHNVNFVFNVSVDVADPPEDAKKDAVIALWLIDIERIYEQPFPGRPSLCTGILSISGGCSGELKKSGQ